MAHEPSGLIGEAKRAVKLMRADTLLAGVHEVEAHHPLVQGDLRPLHDRASGAGEILAAFRLGAAVEARAARDGIGVVD